METQATNPRMLVEDPARLPSPRTAAATDAEVAALLAGMAEEGPTPEQLSEEAAKRLDADLSERFRRSKEARREVAKAMRESMFRREGKYLPEVQAKLNKSRGNRSANNITEAKSAAAEANIAKVVFSSTRSWGLEPTPIAELWPEAKRRVAAAVEAAIGPEREALLDQFEELAAAGAAGGMEESGAGSADIEAALAELDERAEQLQEQEEAAIRKEEEEEAKKRATRMQKVIDDQLAEGGYEKAMRAMIVDFCTYEVAGLMGPIPRRVKERVVVRDDEGTFAVAYRETVIPSVVRLDPWGIYPAALADDVEDGDFFYRQLISDDSAVELFSAGNMLRDRLSEAYRRKGGRLDDDAEARWQSEEVRKVTDAVGESNTGDGMHELVWWWHKMTRREAAGISREVLQADADPEERIGYMGLMLNGMVVSIAPNWDPSGRPQVHLCSYRRRSGSIFGRSLPWLMKDPQNVRNISIRGLLTNLLYSASPSFTADLEMLENPGDILSIYPGKVFQTRHGGPGDNRKAIEAIQVPNFTSAMMTMANQAGVWGDDASGIYPYAYGDNRQKGAAETMGGLRMIVDAQDTMMQLPLLSVNDAQQSLVRAFWLWNMLTPGHEDCRGDQRVVARGVMQLYINSDNIAACTEKLTFFAQNERAARHLRPDGYLRLLRKWFLLSNQDPDDMLMSDQEFAEAVAREQEAAQAQAEAQAAAAQGQGGEGGEEVPPEAGGETAQGVPPKPESESDRIRAEADMMRAQAAVRKAEVEEGKLVLARSREASRLREAQREERASRVATPEIEEAGA